MKNLNNILLRIVIVCTCLLLLVSQGFAGEQQGKWREAGKEIGKAARAVGAASAESWRETKKVTVQTVRKAEKKGAEVWGKTREKSSEAAEKTADVSQDAAKKTAEKSKGFWQHTKEVTGRWFRKAKVKIHELTAPSKKE